MATRKGRRSGPRFTIIVMILLSVTILTLDAKDVPVIGSIRSGVLQALSPVERAFGAVSHPFRNAWKGVSNYDDLERENKRLQAENDKLRGAGEQNDALQAQVNDLKQQLDIPFPQPYQRVVAQVATGNFSSFDDSTAQIDRGSAAGIRVGNPVITNAGLVGRVVRVSASRSVVQLVTDPDLRLGIRVKSDATGLGRGSGPNQPFLVDRSVPLTAQVAKGDLVTTSGSTRAIMPSDLPIGNVTSITRDQGQQIQILEVKLAADLSRLDYVQVIDWTPKA